MNVFVFQGRYGPQSDIRGVQGVEEPHEYPTKNWLHSGQVQLPAQVTTKYP